MSVFDDHPNAHHKNGDGVQKAIQKPVASGLPLKGHTDRVDQQNPVDHMLRIEVQQYIKTNQEGPGHNTQPATIVHAAVENMVVANTRMEAPLG